MSTTQNVVPPPPGRSTGVPAFPDLFHEAPSAPAELQLAPAMVLPVAIPGLKLDAAQARDFSRDLRRVANENAALLAGADSSNMAERQRTAQAARNDLIASLTTMPYGLRIDPNSPSGRALNTAIMNELKQIEDQTRLELLAVNAQGMGRGNRTVQGLSDTMPARLHTQWLEFLALHEDVLTPDARRFLNTRYQAGVGEVQEAIDKARNIYSRLNSALLYRFGGCEGKKVQAILGELDGTTYAWLERVHMRNHGGQSVGDRLGWASFSGVLEFIATSYFSENWNTTLIKQLDGIAKLPTPPIARVSAAHLFGPAERVPFETRLQQLIGANRDEFLAAIAYSAMQKPDPILGLLETLRGTSIEERRVILQSYRRLYCSSAPSTKSDLDAFIDSRPNLRASERAVIRELFTSATGSPTALQISAMITDRGADFGRSQGSWLASVRSTGSSEENLRLRETIISNMDHQERSFLRSVQPYFGNTSEHFLDGLRLARGTVYRNELRRSLLLEEHRLTIREETVKGGTTGAITRDSVRDSRANLTTTLDLHENLFVALILTNGQMSGIGIFGGIRADLHRMHDETHHAYLHNSKIADEIFTSLHENAKADNRGFWDGWADIGTDGKRLAPALRSIRRNNEGRRANSLLTEMGISDLHIVNSIYSDRFNLDARSDIQIDLGDCAEGRMMLALYDGNRVHALVHEAHMLFAGGHKHWFDDGWGTRIRTLSFSPIAAEKKDVEDLIRRYHEMSETERAEFDRMFVEEVIPHLSGASDCRNFKEVIGRFFTWADDRDSLVARCEGKIELAHAIETHQMLNRGVPPVAEILTHARASCIGHDGLYDQEKLMKFFQALDSDPSRARLMVTAKARLGTGSENAPALEALQALANAAALGKDPAKATERRELYAKADACIIRYGLAINGGNINYNLVNTPVQFHFRPNDEQKRVLDGHLKAGNGAEYRRQLEAYTEAARRAQVQHNRRIEEQYSLCYQGDNLRTDADRRLNTQNLGKLRAASFGHRLQSGDLDSVQKLAEALSGITGKRDMAVIRSAMENRFRTAEDKAAYDPDGKRDCIDKLSDDFVQYLKENGISAESLEDYGSRKLTGDDRFDFRNDLVPGNALTGSEMIERLERRKVHEQSGGIGWGSWSVNTGRSLLNAAHLDRQIAELKSFHDRQTELWLASPQRRESESRGRRTRSGSIQTEPIIYELSHGICEEYLTRNHICQESATMLREMKNAMAERVQMVGTIAAVTVAGFFTGGAAWYVTFGFISATSLATTTLIKYGIRGDGYQMFRRDWTESFGENSILQNCLIVPIAYNLFTDEYKHDINHAAVEGLALTITMGCSHAIAEFVGNRVVLLSLGNKVHGLTTAEILAGGFSKNALAAMENEFIKRAVSDFTHNIVVSLITETSGMMTAEFVSGIGMKMVDVGMEKGLIGLVSNIGGTLQDGVRDGANRAAHAAYMAPMFVLGMRYIAQPALTGITNFAKACWTGGVKGFRWTFGIAEPVAAEGAGGKKTGATPEQQKPGTGEESTRPVEGREAETGGERRVVEPAEANRAETPVQEGALTDGETVFVSHTVEAPAGDTVVNNHPGTGTEGRPVVESRQPVVDSHQPVVRGPDTVDPNLFADAGLHHGSPLEGGNPVVADHPRTPLEQHRGRTNDTAETRKKADDSRRAEESRTEQPKKEAAPEARPIEPVNTHGHGGQQTPGSAPEAARPRTIPEEAPTTAEGQRKVLGLENKETPRTLEEWNKTINEALEHAKTPAQEKAVVESARRLMDPQRPEGSWAAFLFGPSVNGWMWRSLQALYYVGESLGNALRFRWGAAGESLQNARARLLERGWADNVKAFLDGGHRAWDPQIHYRARERLLERAKEFDPTLKEVPKNREQWIELIDKATRGLESNEARAEVISKMNKLMREANAHEFWVAETGRYRHMRVGEAEAYFAKMGVDPDTLPRTYHQMEARLLELQKGMSDYQIARLREAAQSWFNANGHPRIFGHYIGWPHQWSTEGAFQRLGLWNDCFMVTHETAAEIVAHAQKAVAKNSEATAQHHRDVAEMESALRYLRRNVDMNGSDPHTYRALRKLDILGQPYEGELLKAAYDAKIAPANAEVRRIREELRKTQEQLDRAKEAEHARNPEGKTPQQPQEGRRSTERSSESRRSNTEPLSAEARKIADLLNEIRKLNHDFLVAQKAADEIHVAYKYLEARIPPAETRSWYNPKRYFVAIFGESFASFTNSSDLPSLDALRRAFRLQANAMEASLAALGDKGGARILDSETINRLHEAALRLHKGNAAMCEQADLAALHLHLLAHSRSMADVPTLEVLKSRIEQFRKSANELGAVHRGRPYTAAEIDALASRLLDPLRKLHQQLVAARNNRAEFETLTKKLEAMEKKTPDANRMRRIQEMRDRLGELEAEYAKMGRSGETAKQLNRMIGENLHKQRLIEAHRAYVKDLLCLQEADGTIRPRFEKSQIRTTRQETAEGGTRTTHHVLQDVRGIDERVAVFTRRDATTARLKLTPGASVEQVEAALLARREKALARVEEMRKKGSDYENSKLDASERAKTIESEITRLLIEQRQTLERLDEFRRNLGNREPSLRDVLKEQEWLEQLIQIDRRMKNWQKLERQVNDIERWTTDILTRSMASADLAVPREILIELAKAKTFDEKIERLAELREQLSKAGHDQALAKEAQVVEQLTRRRTELIRQVQEATRVLAELDARLCSTLKATGSPQLQLVVIESARRMRQLAEIMKHLSPEHAEQIIQKILRDLGVPPGADSRGSSTRSLAQIEAQVRQTNKKELERLFRSTRREKAAELVHEKQQLETQLRDTNDQLQRALQHPARNLELTRQLRSRIEQIKARLAELAPTRLRAAALEAARLAEDLEIARLCNQAWIRQIELRAHDVIVELRRRCGFDFDLYTEQQIIEHAARTGAAPEQVAAEIARMKMEAKDELLRLYDEARSQATIEQQAENFRHSISEAELILREAPAEIRQLSDGEIKRIASEDAQRVLEAHNSHIELELLSLIEEAVASTARQHLSQLRGSAGQSPALNEAAFEGLVRDSIQAQLSEWKKAIDYIIQAHDEARALMKEMMRQESLFPELNALPEAMRHHEQRARNLHKRETRRLENELARETARLESELEYGGTREAALRQRLNELNELKQTEEVVQERARLTRELAREDWSRKREKLERRLEELTDERIAAEVESAREVRRLLESDQAEARRAQIERSCNAAEGRLERLNQRYNELTPEFVAAEGQKARADLLEKARGSTEAELSHAATRRERQLKLERAQVAREIRRVAEAVRGPVGSDVPQLTRQEIEFEVARIRAEAEKRLPQNKGADDLQRKLLSEREGIQKTLRETNWEGERAKLRENVARLRQELSVDESARRLNSLHEQLAQIRRNRLTEKRTRHSLNEEFVSKYAREVSERYFKQESKRIESEKHRIQQELRELQRIEDELLGRVNEGGERLGGLLEFSTCFQGGYQPGELSTEAAIRWLGYKPGDVLPDTPEGWREAMHRRLDTEFELWKRLRIIDAATKMMNDSLNISKRPVFWSEVWKATVNLSIERGLYRIAELFGEQLVWSFRQLGQALFYDPWSMKLDRIGRIIFGDSFCISRDLRWALEFQGSSKISEYLLHETVVARDYGLKTTTSTRNVLIENWMCWIIPLPDIIPIRFLRSINFLIIFPNRALQANLARELILRHGDLNLADPSFAKACHAIEARKHIGRLNALTESEIRYAASKARANPGANAETILAAETYLCGLLPQSGVSEAWWFMKPFVYLAEVLMPPRLVNSTIKSEKLSLANCERLAKLHIEGIARAKKVISRTGEAVGYHADALRSDIHLSEYSPARYRALVESRDPTLWAEYEAAFTYLEQFPSGVEGRTTARIFRSLSSHTMHLNEFVTFERLCQIYRNMNSAIRALNMRDVSGYHFWNNLSRGDFSVHHAAEQILTRLNGELARAESVYDARVAALGRHAPPQTLKLLRTEFLKTKNRLLREIREVSASRDLLMDLTLHTRSEDPFRIVAFREGARSLDSIALLKERIETFHLRDRLNASIGMKAGKDHAPDVVQQHTKKALNQFADEVRQARDRAVEEAYRKLKPGEVFSMNNVDMREVNALLASERGLRLRCTEDFLIEFGERGTRLRSPWQSEAVVSEKGLLRQRINNSVVDHPFSEARLQAFRDMMTVGEILGVPGEFAFSREMTNAAKYESFRKYYETALANAKDMASRNRVEAAMSFVEDLLLRSVNGRVARVDQIESLAKRLKKIQERALALEMVGMNPEARCFTAEEVKAYHDAQVEKMPWLTRELGAARDHLLMLLGRKPRALALKELGLQGEGRRYSYEELDAAYKKKASENPADEPSLREARDSAYEILWKEGEADVRWHERGGWWNPTNWPIISYIKLHHAFNLVGDAFNIIRWMLPSRLVSWFDRSLSLIADQAAFWRRMGWVRAEYQGTGLMENLAKIAAEGRMSRTDADLFRYQQNPAQTRPTGHHEQLYHDLMNDPKAFWKHLQGAVKRTPIDKDLITLELFGNGGVTRERGLLLESRKAVQNLEVLTDPVKLLEHCERLIAEANGDPKRIREIVEAYNRLAANLKPGLPWRFGILPPRDSFIGRLLGRYYDFLGTMLHDIPKFLLIMYVLTRFSFFRWLFGNWDIFGTGDDDFDDFLKRLSRKSSRWGSPLKSRGMLSPNADDDVITADSHGWWEDMGQRELEDPEHQKDEKDFETANVLQEQRNEFFAAMPAPIGQSDSDDDGEPGVPRIKPQAPDAEARERDKAQVRFHDAMSANSARHARMQNLRLPDKGTGMLSEYFSRSRFPFLG